MKILILFIIVSNVYFYVDIVFGYNLSAWISNFLKSEKFKTLLTSILKFLKFKK